MARDLAYGVTRVSAIVIGAGLTGYSALLTWTHTHDISGPLAAVVGAMLFVFGEAAWHNHRRARAVAFAVLAILASGISGLAVLARTSSTADERIQVQRTANLPRELAQKALETAEASVVATEAAASAECSSGSGPRCRGLEGRATEARTRRDQARTELIRLGARSVEDPAARRLAAFLPGVSETTIGLAMPVALPLWLELSGPLLLGFGLASRRHKVKRRRGKLKKGRARKKRTPQKPAKRLGNVVRFPRAI